MNPRIAFALFWLASSSAAVAVPLDELERTLCGAKLVYSAQLHLNTDETDLGLVSHTAAHPTNFVVEPVALTLKQAAAPRLPTVMPFHSRWEAEGQTKAYTPQLLDGKLLVVLVNVKVTTMVTHNCTHAELADGDEKCQNVSVRTSYQYKIASSVGDREVGTKLTHTEPFFQPEGVVTTEIPLQNWESGPKKHQLVLTIVREGSAPQANDGSDEFGVSPGGSDRGIQLFYLNLFGKN